MSSEGTTGSTARAEFGGACAGTVAFSRYKGPGTTAVVERPVPIPGPTFLRVMAEFAQQRHKTPLELERPRELVVACPPMRSNVNLSRIARAAGCCGVQRMVCCGNAKIIGKIARDAETCLEVEIHRTLPPVLKRLREEGYALVGLEQTNDSRSIFDFHFERKTVLVVGNERLGVEDETLRLLDQTIEIPVYGRPYAHNAATATVMALYEYCRQYPRG